jgi:hypothetical protein
MFIALKAAASCSGVVLAFRASQAALKSAFAAHLRAPETAERLAKSAWPGYSSASSAASGKGSGIA